MTIFKVTDTGIVIKEILPRGFGPLEFYDRDRPTADCVFHMAIILLTIMSLDCQVVLL